MFHDKDALKEIYELLDSAAKFIRVPVLESELRSISNRLLRYHGPELFRVLLDIGQNSKFMPSGAELEQRVRRAIGKDPAKGLSLEQIEANKLEAIRSGQSPEAAERGAEMMRGTLRLRRAEPPPPASAPAEKIPLPESFDPIAALDDFDEDPLAGLDDF